MARDRKGIPISEVENIGFLILFLFIQQCIRLISGLLRQENQQPTKSDEDYKKHVSQVKLIFIFKKIKEFSDLVDNARLASLLGEQVHETHPT